ncbi:hypothetical protein ACH4S8_31670 [Streptomyces sp. NPDC021080]|uniref:hypothetical protein n=1 Tax=Streptomyces sp. NPDC021080 TaxID=3365110 RepID=UPI0037BA0149
MAKRKVQRRVRTILGEDPTAMVWCEVHKGIPKPPADVHRAAGKGRLKPGHHWLLYVGAVAFFFVVVPMMLIDKLGDRLGGPSPARRSRSSRTAPGGTSVDGRPTARDRERGERTDGVFDGDWDLTAGRLLLRWYTQSPNPKRLVMLTPDRVCLAASPRRRLSPTKADDFRIVVEYPSSEVRVEGEAGQPRGFATFRLCFTDGSWLELGRLAQPADADSFLRRVDTGR